VFFQIQLLANACVQSCLVKNLNWTQPLPFLLYWTKKKKCIKLSWNKSAACHKVWESTRERNSASKTEKETMKERKRNTQKAAGQRKINKSHNNTRNFLYPAHISTQAFCIFELRVYSKKFHSTAETETENRGSSSSSSRGSNNRGRATVGAATTVCFLMLDAALQLWVYCVALLFI